MINKINNYILSAVLITSIVLIWQIYTLPQKISKALNMTAEDTVIIKVPDNLTIKKDMVYFEGETIDKSIQISKSFKYNPDYPREFWDGYLTLSKSSSGGKYFIWSSQEILEKNISGWFMVSIGKWQNEKDYIQAIIPIVRKNNE